MHELRRRRKQIVASRPDTWTSLLPNNPFRLYEFKEGDAQSRFTIMKSARVKVDLIDDAYAGPSLESLRNSKPSVFPFKSSENCAPRKFNACLSTINLSRKAYLKVVFVLTCFSTEVWLGMISLPKTFFGWIPFDDDEASLRMTETLWHARPLNRVTHTTAHFLLYPYNPFFSAAMVVKKGQLYKVFGMQWIRWCVAGFRSNLKTSYNWIRQTWVLIRMNKNS